MCKKLKFDHTKKILYAQLGICSGEWNPKTSLGFWDTNRSPNLNQTTRPSDSQKQQKRKKKKRENQWTRQATE